MVEWAALLYHTHWSDGYGLWVWEDRLIFICTGAPGPGMNELDHDIHGCFPVLLSKHMFGKCQRFPSLTMSSVVDTKLLIHRGIDCLYLQPD